MKDSIFTDKTFKLAFTISLVSHAFLFLKVPDVSFSNVDRQIEITYLKQKPLVDSVADADIKSLKLTVEEAPLELNLAKGNPGRKEDFISLKNEKAVERKVVIKEIREELREERDALHKLPGFYAYYQYLRQKIKQASFHPRPFMGGEVLVKFTLFCDGTLKEVSVVEKLSADNAYLRYAAVQSVKNASPFEPFPKELAVKEIPFQIPISFEISN